MIEINENGIPTFIDTERTEENIKSILKLIKELFEMKFYELPDYKEHEITETLNFKNVLVVNVSTKYDGLVKKVLEVFTVLAEEQKRVMYYHCLKGYSFFAIQKGLNKEEVEISSAFYHYRKALNFMLVTIQEAIVYREV